VKRPLGAGEWAVLAVVAEGPTHGFAVAKTLAPDGEIGRVWSLSRPLVYRALDQLVRNGLVAKGAAEPSGRGPRRTSVLATPTGRRLVERWLLMLKLLFVERSGRDPRPLLDAERELLVPVAAALEERRRSVTGFERTLVQWRLESTLAVLRFLDSASVDAGRR
jgi:DNA-binding PadR family transcriptional regulator